MKVLVVVEGKGKIAALRQSIVPLMPSLGWSGLEVLATKGHVAGNPSFGAARSGHGWDEPEYGPSQNRSDELAAIAKAAARADLVVLAMDDDQEGDVIARDVARFAIADKRAVRCRLRAIDRAGLALALHSARPLDPADAIPGDARRIVDRLIGACLSDLSIEKNKRPVGRVFSSALALLDEEPAILGSVRIAVPANDGGGPFVGDIPFTRDTDLSLLTSVCESRAAPAEPADEAVCTPWNYRDILVNVSTRLHIPLKQAAAGLQEAYERGRLSYPRAGSRAVSDAGLSVCEEIARRNGCTFFPERIARFAEDAQGEGAHEAPRPLGALSLDRMPFGAGLGIAECVTTMVARNLIEAGQRHVVEHPRVADLPDHLAPMASRLRRVKLEGWLCWKEPLDGGGQIRRYDKDVALLVALSSAGIGRPATWVKHVANLVERGVAKEDLSLSKRGANLLALARERGIYRDFASDVERVVSNASELSASERAKHALAAVAPGVLRHVEQAISAHDHIVEGHEYET